MYFRLARAGAGSFLVVGTGIGDIGGRFLNISTRGREIYAEARVHPCLRR
jgi:hypothetical protein